MAKSFIDVVQDSPRAGLGIPVKTRGVQKDSIRFSTRYWPSVECQIFDIRRSVFRTYDNILATTLG